MKENIGVRYLKLPFYFEAEKLVEELKLIEAVEWKDHFNTNGYSGNWTSIALYSTDGDENSILVPLEKTVLKETAALKECRYIKEVISTFKSSLIAVRLLKLEKGSEIKPHKDFNLGYEDGCFRLHIPIITNDKVSFILDDERVVMNPGECWYTNVNYTHAVSNLGTTDRIHLVIDLERNDWSDAIFFSLANKEDFFRTETINHDRDTMQKIIKELELQDTPAAKELIQQLKNQS